MVAKFLDLKQPFLKETTICIFERWKKSMSYHFSFFYLPYLQDHGLWRSRNFATMATWRNDFSLCVLGFKINTKKLWHSSINIGVNVLLLLSHMSYFRHVEFHMAFRLFVILLVQTILRRWSRILKRRIYGTRASHGTEQKFSANN